MKRFSQRQGFKAVKSVVQVDAMDTNLRNGLWNALDIHYWRPLRHLSARAPFQRESWPTELVAALWADYFKWTIDSIPELGSMACDTIKKYFFNCQFYEVYDFIEFIATNYKVASTNENFIELCNSILERELSGYRFIGSQIVPITAEEELAEIEEALKLTGALTPVAIHLATAMGHLSDRKCPDYRNSIKESISAVEAICRLIAGDDKAKLGQALKAIRSRVHLHPALEKAFSSLYGYTSDADGIRHALLSESDLSFGDAKFMLVSCAAFINYLKLKSSEAGTNF